jgi:hypothetical protein
VGSATGCPLERDCPLVRDEGSGGNTTRGSVSVGRRRGSSREIITVGSIESGIAGDPLARLMRTVGSVEMTSEPGAPA